MPRKETEAVPEGNDPVPPREKFGSGQPTRLDVYRKIEEVWDRKMDEIMRLLEQHLASLEQDARQPCFAMVADGQGNTKTRERTEVAAAALQAMHGDVLPTGLIPTRYVLPASVMTAPDLRHPFV